MYLNALSIDCIHDRLPKILMGMGDPLPQVSHSNNYLAGQQEKK